MDRLETMGATATASMLRELADEIEKGLVRACDTELAVAERGVSAVVDGSELSDGSLSVSVRLVEAPSGSHQRKGLMSLVLDGGRGEDASRGTDRRPST